MARATRLTTTLSTKGQVILPMAVRQRLNWDTGARLLVEETADGVLLRPAPAFAETASKDVFGLLRTSAPAKTLAEMDAGVLAEARHRGRD